jgi:hypothetical protein
LEEDAEEDGGGKRRVSGSMAASSDCGADRVWNTIEMSKFEMSLVITTQN